MITNFAAVKEMLMGMAVIDKKWLADHIVVVDMMTFDQQVRLAESSDVIITVHGAAIANGIFMRKGSVVIDVYNGRYLEFNFDPMLRESGVKLQHVIVWDHTNVTDCSPFPPFCLEGPVTDGIDMRCLGIRQCSVAVSTDVLYVSVMEAYSHVISSDMSRR